MTAQMVSLICILLMWQARGSAQSPPMAKPGCPSKCGNLTIPFPFGIGAACSFNSWFDIDCSLNQKPFMKSFGLEVLSISIEGTIRVNHPIFSTCQINTATFVGVDLRGSPFMFNYTSNRFTGVGCNNFIFMSSSLLDISNGGCVSMCQLVDYQPNPYSCSGINCCQTGIPSNLKWFIAKVSTINNSSPIHNCRYAFLVDQQWFDSNA